MLCCLYAAQGSKEGSDASAHGLWGEDDGNQPGLHLMHTLLILNETRVLDAVLRMAHGLAFDQVRGHRRIPHTMSTGSYYKVPVQRS